jgi:hypothetical protein
MSKVVDGIFGGSDASSDAAKVQAASSTAAVAENRRQFDKTQQNLQPFIKAGERALMEQRALLGLYGEGRQKNAINRFVDSPGEAFLRERGERALLQNQAAIGGLGGGNVRSALNEQGIGFARQQFNNHMAQLAGMSGTGSTTAVNLGTIGANSANAIGQNLQAGGQARASGILGAQQANAGLGGQVFSAGLGAAAGSMGLLGSGVTAGGGALLGLMSDERLKTNIVKIDTHKSGLGWYRWEWNEEGQRVAGSEPPEGFIAQEVQKLYPAAVGERDGYLTVDYRRVA